MSSPGNAPRIDAWRSPPTSPIRAVRAAVRKSTGWRRPGPDVAEVIEALAKLKEGDIQVIKSLFWDNRSEAEVAELLGISQQAVSKRKLAILGRLRRLLDPSGTITENVVVTIRLRIN